ncbi:hypothetical protein FKP32DRAFT_1577618 [Trametes sanguinea]|nr:hypothetical protein FKP32DRAFT_1577618 [Trametes sanguinea]
MHLLDLNDDVLLYLATFLLRKQVSLFSKTCHRLHSLLTPILLEERVWLTRANLVSFASFVEAGHTRTSCFYARLRSITLNIFPNLRKSLTFDALAPAFSEMLPYIQNLSDLTIHFVQLAFSPAQMRHILGSLPSLRLVTLNEITVGYHDVLADVHPQLKAVGLGLVSDAYNLNPDAFSPVDPRPFLHYHRSSVNNVVLSQVSLDASGLPFPGVRDLEISGYALSDAESGFTGPLVHLFPNVERVRLWSLRFDPGWIATSFEYQANLPLINTLRNASRLWQATHGTWTTGLQVLRVGYLVELYCLGLNCDVARVDSLFTWDGLGVARAALANVRARCLKFSISTRQELVDETSTLLLDAVSQTQSLDHLMIDISVSVLFEVPFSSLLAQLGDLLKGSNVKHLLVHIEGDAVPIGPPMALPTVSQLAADAYAQAPQVLPSLVSGNRTLFRVFIDFKGLGLKAWERSTTGGEEDRWNEMDELRARRILVAEGMVRYED